MQVKAHARTVRIAPRKVQLVLSAIRRASAVKALSTLDNLPKRAAAVVKKLLQSAIANAVNNHALETQDLVIKEVFVTSGPTAKRFQPRAHGRAFPIRKRTSNITIILDDQH